jgi:prepilin-type N-terminal cleavage/methylation domain-containing protein
MSLRIKRSSRVGFTLIELLMVITVMGLLMSMLSVAVFRALSSARVRAVIFEMGQIGNAIQSYKEAKSQFPPNMGDTVATQLQNRTMLHFRIAYPRYNPAGNSFTSIQNAVASVSATAPGYNYMNSGGQTKPLLFVNMDQAEALVFWLGGFPTPIATGANAGGYVSSRKLFGFHTDATNPIKRDVGVGQQVTQFRTTPIYDFDEGRLVDNDQDGWYEYVPKGLQPNGDGFMPPFVYFDWACYSQLTALNVTPVPYQAYPPTMGQQAASNGMMQTLFSEWGAAVPSASNPNKLNASALQSNWAASPVSWINPNTYQIICAGQDATYGDPTVSAPGLRLPVFPDGTTFTGNKFSTLGYYSTQELDNLSNFTDSTFEDALPN